MSQLNPNLPGNSLGSRNTQSPLSATEKKIADLPKKNEREPIQKVITGRVTQRRKGTGSKFMEVFFGNDMKGTADYILWEVAVPEFKAYLVEIGTSALERFLGGGRGARRAASVLRTAANNSNFDYNRASRTTSTNRTTVQRTVSPRARHDFDFAEIVLESRNEASVVVEKMLDLIDKYEYVTVEDLYKAVGISSIDYMAQAWGWDSESFGDPQIRRVREGYLIDLDPPVHLQ
jgi:hypothetical protein